MKDARAAFSLRSDHLLPNPQHLMSPSPTTSATKPRLGCVAPERSVAAQLAGGDVCVVIDAAAAHTEEAEQTVSFSPFFICSGHL